MALLLLTSQRKRIMDGTTGSKGVVWATIGAELIAVCYELRYMVILSLILILADLWWGYCESSKRYNQAVVDKDKAAKEKYKWHKSRAVRRSANKAVDYITYLLVGAFLGLAITEPMDLCNHVLTAAIALGLGCLCEVSSIVGHVLFVKAGIEIKVADAWKWAGRFFINLIKIKNHDIGEAVDTTVNNKKGRRHDAFEKRNDNI